MDEGGCRKGAFLSEEAQCGGSLGRAPLLGTLEDMLSKAPDMGISFHSGPFLSEGNLESEGRARIPRTLKDERRRALGTGHLSLRGDSMRGPGGRAPLVGTPKDMLSKALEWNSVSISVPILENMEGRSFLRAFEIKRYIKRDVKMP
jgi:hypothetical protein